MSVPSTLSKSLGSAVRHIVLFCAASIASPACVASGGPDVNDLKDPDKLLALRHNASQQDRLLADKMYRHATEAAKKDAASAAKAFGESALIYPTSRALAGLAEHRAKMLAKKRDDVKREALREISAYLNSAERLNAVDKLLTREEARWLAEDKACINQRLANQDTRTECRPVQWLEMR